MRTTDVTEDRPTAAQHIVKARCCTSCGHRILGELAKYHVRQKDANGKNVKVCLLKNTAHAVTTEFTKGNKLKRRRRNKHTHACQHCEDGTAHDYPAVAQLVYNDD